ncbi:MAG TPA: FtsX-like permease family protein [Gaiellaceae bacterium]|nr:FtsX-like permease family protein [Gaiellaceae bacterium]
MGGRRGSGTRFRAALASIGVSTARLRSQPLRPVLVVAGVALAFAMAVAILGGSLVARQQALGQAISGLPDSAQTFRVDRFGVPLSHATYERENRIVRRVLGTLSHGEVRRIVFFRQIRVAGQLVEIVGVDRPQEIVRLRSGRLPRTCNEAGCEMLQIGSAGRARLHEGDIRLDRVGTADLRDPGFFGYISAAAEGPAAPPLVLIAPSVEAVERLPSLQPFYRVYSWLSPLRATSLHTWDVGTTLAAESRGQTVLYAADSAFRLSSPDDRLLDATHRGSIAARRLILVGGETSALLLGFAIIAAIGLRRGLAGERRRLLARGARRWQAWLALAAEVGAMTLTGAVLGTAAGAGVVAGIAGAAGEPAGAILSHTLLTAWAIPALVAAVLAVTLVLTATTLTRDDEEGRRRRFGLIDVAALGAAATIAVGLSRGALDPDSVSGGNTVLLLILPALVCFVVAVVLARLIAPAMRATERLTRRRSLTLRLGVLALARAPSRTVVSCSFITVALGLALFAAAYRATLSRGSSDQAAFEVPLDYTVAEGSKLVMPLDAAPLAAYARTAPGAHAYPVLRLAATTPGAGTAVLSPTVLGLPAAAMSHLRWRSDFSSLPPAQIERRLSAQGEPRLRGVRIPAGTTTLSTVARLRGADVVARIVAADPRGRISLLRLGRVRPGARRLSATVPAQGPLRVLGIQLELPESEAFMLTHRDSEGEVSVAPAGELTLGPLLAGSRTLTDWRDWTLSTGGDVLPGAGRTTVRYAFPDAGTRLVFRPRQPTDGGQMPAVVSPDIARAAGGVGATATLDFQDTHVDARIVGVASRLPTVPADSGPFVLADGAWLSTAIDANAPGEGTPNEVWLSTPGDGSIAARALAGPPFSSLVVTSRAAIESRLAGDPLAHATAVALGAAGLVALVLAVLGFWVGVVSELHDEKSDFFDLEAQGLPPADMRRQLRMRGVILLVLGFAGGLALAVLLSRLVVSLIRVSGTTGVPEPPLRLDPDWLVAGLGIAALMLAALIVAEGASLAAFRGSRPERASWSLE